MQNTTLMNGVDGLWIEEIDASPAHAIMGRRLFKVGLKMTDGAKLNIELERMFSTRNLL